MHLVDGLDVEESLAKEIEELNREFGEGGAS